MIRMVSYAAALAGVLVLAAVVSDAEDWQPVGLVVALAVLMTLADTVMVPARRIYVSAGLLVLVTVMALLGPAPAAFIAVAASATASLIRATPVPPALANLLIFALLGLLGGLLFEAARAAFGLEREDAAYAGLTTLAYVLLGALNLALVALLNPRLEGDRRRVFRESGIPLVPWQLVNALLSGLTVLVWVHAGQAAVAGLIVVLVFSIPLLQTVGGAIQSGDDRDRLFSELLLAERRERGRLAELLHDGPVQRLAALRLRADGEMARQLDAAIEETRAIVASLHPETVRELGFEGALRAAAAPFSSSRPFALTVHSELDDRALADTLLLPVAQELVVNAAKHARPAAIAVTVTADGGRIALEVCDDGAGYVPPREAGHAGLAIVGRRVKDAGGSLQIEPGSPRGTQVRVTVPLGGIA